MLSWQVGWENESALCLRVKGRGKVSKRLEKEGELVDGGQRPKTSPGEAVAHVCPLWLLTIQGLSFTSPVPSHSFLVVVDRGIWDNVSFHEELSMTLVPFVTAIPSH